MIQVIIADDDPDDLTLTKIAFAEAREDVALDFVRDGVELLEFVRVKVSELNPPRFILLDLNMPRMDGREVLGEMRKDQDLKNIPVIVFTTSKNKSEIKRCYELGANSYIVKPMSFEELKSIVKYLCSFWVDIAASPA